MYYFFYNTVFFPMKENLPVSVITTGRRSLLAARRSSLRMPSSTTAGSTGKGRSTRFSSDGLVGYYLQCRMHARRWATGVTAMSLEIPETFSREVFCDGHDAIRDYKAGTYKHPCHHMIRWQDERGIKPYQLPEPFSGRRSKYRLIFAGLNPSLSENEKIPVATDDWDFGSYDAYYRARFDHRNSNGKLVALLENGNQKIPHLWRSIEAFGRRIFAEEANSFELGQHAILLEIVHYKSWRGWLGDTPSEKEILLKHQSCFTGRLLEEIAPCVLVAMGNIAVRQLIPLLNLPLEAKPQVRKLMGMTFEGQRMPSGARVLVTPTQHPAAFPTTPEKWQAAARAICQAIKDIS